MTLSTLVSEIAKKEGKKREVPVGDIREILRIIGDLEIEYRIVSSRPGPLSALDKYVNNKIKKGNKGAKKTKTNKSKKKNVGRSKQKKSVKKKTKTRRVNK